MLLLPMSVRALLAVALCSACGPSLAQYKVVQPDGSVTYTDRPTSAPGAKIITLGRRGAALASSEAPDTSLPAELRQPAMRYPVTLYTTANCAPCDNARQMLTQRGIPFAERRVSSDEDGQALEKAIGGRAVPSLTIGTQPMRGYSETDWGAYLDAAGYPRESRLPRGWAPPAQAERPAPRPPAPRDAPPVDVPVIETPPAGGVRF